MGGRPADLLGGREYGLRVYSPTISLGSQLAYRLSLIVMVFVSRDADRMTASAAARIAGDSVGHIRIISAISGATSASSARLFA